MGTPVRGPVDLSVSAMSAFPPADHVAALRSFYAAPNPEKVSQVRASMRRGECRGVGEGI